MKTNFSQKPNKLEMIGNGSYFYRFNIEETTTEVFDGENVATVESWYADEVVVWEPITANKITAEVISCICPASHEQKLVNEYNAAKLGLIDGEEAEKKIAAYMDFLRLRADMKAQVDKDCEELGIK